MQLLAIDTSSDACSAALLQGGTVSERQEQTQREHGPKVLAMIDALLVDAGIELSALDAIVFGCGPGSFTGLRIAAGITQGLAFAAGLPVIPVSSLAMLAQGLLDEREVSNVAVCLDARMGEAYVGFFRRDSGGLARPVTDEALLRPDMISLPSAGDSWAATGPGWAAFAGLAERLGLAPAPAELARLPSARHALRLGEALWCAGKKCSPDQALPVYLREKVAWQT